MQSFSIQRRYGMKALAALRRFVFARRAFKYAVPEFVAATYGSETDFCDAASEAMLAAGLGMDTETTGCRLKRFLNRMFGVPLKLQSDIFELFFYLVSACPNLVSYRLLMLRRLADGGGDS